MSVRFHHLAHHLVLGLLLAAPTAPAWADSGPNDPHVPDPTASTDMRPTGQAKPILEPQKNRKHIPQADRDFLSESARNDVLQIRLGRLAAQQSGAPALKRFAGHIVTDHSSFTRQRDELVALSDAKLPKDLDKNGEATVDRLSPLHDTAFDKPYLQAAIDGENEAIAATKQEIAQGSDPDVVAWAKGALPVLERHVADARRLAPAKDARS